jgi:hypothetical protein
MKAETITDLVRYAIDKGAETAHTNMHTRFENVVRVVAKFEKEYDSFFNNVIEKNSRYTEVIKNTVTKFESELETYLRWNNLEFYLKLFTSDKVKEYDKNCIFTSYFVVHIKGQRDPVLCKCKQKDNKPVFYETIDKRELSYTEIIKILRLI